MTSENPISITEIRKSQQGEFVLEDIKRGANLGGMHDKRAAELESRLNPMLNSLKDRAEQLFVLEWEGTRVPRGARINDMEIGWTQHGIVTSVDGETIGYYDRLVDQGGESGRFNQMIIYI